MATHNELGNLGEEKASAFLLEKAYLILERNWRKSRFEIDIIAQREEFIVFVEVKTRSSSVFGEPIEFVSEKKQQMMINAAEVYLELNPQIHQPEVRFDIISVIIANNQVKIEHFPDAFADIP
jgi:putative endonuclease